LINGCDKFLSRIRNEEVAIESNMFINETIQFLSSNPDSTAIMVHINFNHNLPLETSHLKLLPPFFQVAMLELILPHCTNEDRFNEAFKIFLKAFNFSQVFYDQLNEKFPHIADKSFGGLCLLLPAGQRAKHQKRLVNTVLGLDYLLSRNIKSPFILQDLTDMNPDIHKLIKTFLHQNTLSLTEVDMIAQMKEAGLFSGIQDELLFNRLESDFSGSIRCHMRSIYFKFF